MREHIEICTIEDGSDHYVVLNRYSGRKQKSTVGCFDHNGLTYIIAGDAPEGMFPKTAKMRHFRCGDYVHYYFYSWRRMAFVGVIRSIMADCTLNFLLCFKIRHHSRTAGTHPEYRADKPRRKPTVNRFADGTTKNKNTDWQKSELTQGNGTKC